MKAIMCKTFSSVSNLSWEEAPDPVAGPKEIVIDEVSGQFIAILGCV